MHELHIASVFLHVLAAMVWIGGAAFIALSLIPVMRRRPASPEGTALLHAIATRFRTVGWASLSILIITGCVNLHFRGIGLTALLSGSAFEGPMGRALAVKLLCVAAILALSGLHDFRLGPAAAEAIHRNPDSDAAKRGRRTAAWMGRIVLLFGLGVTLAAVVFVRGGW